MAETSDKTEGRQTQARNIARRIFRHENAVLVIILVIMLAVMAGITGGRSIDPTNVMNVLLGSAARGVVAIGQAFVILTAGIDLSVGGLALMCALLGAKLVTERPEHLLAYPAPLGLAIPLMLLTGLGVGLLNGSLVSRVHIPPLIVTLGMWIITGGGGLIISEGHHIMGIPRSLAFFGQGYIGPIPVPVVVFIVAAVIAYFVLNYTTFGRDIYAVGGNPVSAYLSGINVPRILTSVYIISGFMAALAGLITLSRNLMATNLMVSGLELDSIASVVVGGVSLFGGRGNLIGVVIGVIIMGVVNNGLIVMAIDPTLQQLVKGSVIFAAVAVDTLRRR
jgi:ribose/xylose/arabinose/galactoside ABC-type transport system permease subunit